MNEQHKTWSSNFVLDGAKLTRLHEELSDRLSATAKKSDFRFVATTRKHVSSTRSDIADVLRLDNTRKDPITSLTIEGMAQTNDSVDLSASVEFTNPPIGDKLKDNIHLKVTGENQTRVNELFAAAFEQIERTLITPWSQVLAIIAFVAIFLITLVTFLHPQVGLYGSPLSERDIGELTKMAADAPDSESRMAFVFEVQKREIITLAKRYQPVDFTGKSLPTMLVVGGIVLVTCSLLLYLVVVCYPRAVFAWGDYGEYYATLVSRRNGIWKFLVITLAGGVVISLFGRSIQQWLKIEQ